MKRNDNRGASFVMVVVAMAIVAVLAVTVLWIALMNLQMKVTDEKNTDNFYSAEGVLDQICTGLQGDISKAYSAGYTKVMENYSDSSINEAGRQSNFAQEYLKSLKTSLEYDSTGMTFNMGKLIQYVDPKLLEKKDNQPRAIIKSTNADVNGNGQLKVYQNRVVLNGLRVEYTDEKGFKSIIETDISLGVPSMSFTASGGVPELFTYSLVGNEGLDIISGLNKVNLSGNLYAGCENAAGTGTSTTSVTIPNNATLDVKDTSYMIAEGDIEVGDFAGKDTGTIKKNMAGVHNNSTLSVDSQCQLWTSNINVNGATVKLDGMTYVADDMTLKGTGSKVTLGKNNKNNNAKYVGFGNGGADKENPVAGDSSAIIINYNGQYDLALADAKEVMASSLYKLYTRDNYVESWSKTYTDESIFELSITTNYNAQRNAVGYYCDSEGYAECAFVESAPLYQYLSTHPEDIRSKMIKDQSSEKEYTYPAKYPAKYPGRENSLYVNNPKIIRLSEVYLIAAEAALHVQPSEAAGYINALRKQRIENYTDVASVSLEDILMERRIELFAENSVSFDYWRNKMSVNNYYVGTINYDDYRTVLPIPQDEIDLSADKLVQNPNY